MKYVIAILLSICLYFLVVSICQAEVRDVKCLHTLYKNSQVVYSIAIFYNKDEADAFSLKNNGEVLKEQGKDMWYVFPKGIFQQCDDFVWTTRG